MEVKYLLCDTCQRDNRETRAVKRLSLMQRGVEYHLDVCEGHDVSAYAHKAQIQEKQPMLREVRRVRTRKANFAVPIRRSQELPAEWMTSKEAGERLGRKTHLPDVVRPVARWMPPGRKGTPQYVYDRTEVEALARKRGMQVQAGSA